jgi:hypothetical protein
MDSETVVSMINKAVLSSFWIIVSILFLIIFGLLVYPIVTRIEWFGEHIERKHGNITAVIYVVLYVALLFLGFAYLEFYL